MNICVRKIIYCVTKLVNYVCIVYRIITYSTVGSKILKVSKEFNIVSVEIKKIKTEGDLNQKDRLSEIGGKGLFSNKIELHL